ncbi:hypothetical protein vBValSX1_93 [Vibrio phage vB_ValS_X1]|uniref:Uncharacterized protein n=1 Tax=Vibrio phage vB_ValS_X1 TaxID=2736341 RepID=A0A6M9Z720_9CAUD|nr:hypothetical protein vBValSX1_93 [Vibrio phage vB_ValS_X1]
MTRPQLLDIIAAIAASHPDITYMYMQGRCVQFAYILVEILKNEETRIVYSQIEGHAYTEWEGYYWDIRGAHSNVPKDIANITEFPEHKMWAANDTRRLLAHTEKHPLHTGTVSQHIGDN